MVDYLLKRAGEDLDYPFDWSSALADGESISSVTTTITPQETDGLTVDSGGSSAPNDIAAPLLSGGVAGHVYRVVSEIQTDQGRTDQDERVIRVT